MKPLGIVRRIDALGRVVIPKEWRTQHNLAPNDPVEFFADNDGTLTLRKYQLGDKLTASVSAMRSTVEEYGDSFPYHVTVALKKHCSEMQKIIEENWKV